MGSPTTRGLRQKMVYFGALLVLFLVALAGFIWLFIKMVFLSTG